MHWTCSLLRKVSHTRIVLAGFFAFFGLGVIASAASAATYTAVDSAALTSLLGSTVLGDTIVLVANTTYTAPSGGFILPAKTGSGYLTIQSSNLASLPAAGTRVQPSDAANMPKIRPATIDQAMRTVAPPAVTHHIKLIGLEFIGPASNQTYANWPLIEIGRTSSTQNDLTLVPHDIVIDRCYLHENSDTQGLKRNIGLHGKNVDIINCYISGGRDVNSEGQCIWGVNGPGPFNIINNFLQGAGENIMFGGAANQITGMTPSDILVQRNHFYKPWSWFGGTPHWAVKNHFELKCGNNVTVDSNLFENCWLDAGQQYGASIVLKCSRSPTGGSPWFTVDNVQVTNNIIRNVSIGVQIAGSVNADGTSMIGLYPDHVTVRNNLLYKIIIGNTVNRGWAFSTGSGAPNTTFDHNTAFHERNALFAGDNQHDHNNFVFTNNMTMKAGYGIWGSGGSDGEVTFGLYYPGVTYLKNVLMGSSLANYSPSYLGGWDLTPFNNPNLGLPTSWSGVLVNQADPTPEANNYAGFKVVGWDQPTNTALYPYNNTGTDGKDIGCDIDQVVAATAGCISGVWSGGGGTGLIAYDGFNYTGNLNTQNGGTGFGNAWTAVSGQGNPAISTGGSLTYASGPNQLTTVGNKLGPAVTCQSVRNFASTISAANTTKWVSFRIKYNGGGALTTNHVGFPLFPSLDGAGTSIFLGKPGSATNWGVDIGGTQSNVSGTPQTDAFLLFKLVFTSTQVTVSMWVNPNLTSEASLGTSHITPLTVSHGTQLRSMKMSTGTNASNYQLDEFRIGNAFADVTVSTAVEVIVDNPAATLVGTWTTSTWTGGGQFEGSNYVHDGDTGKGSKTCTWTPNIPFTGTYQVYAKWTSNTDRTNAAPYVVNHAGGLTGTITKNQQSNGGTWQLLDTRTFNAGTAGYVRLSTTGTTGFVIADAVRFVKQ